MMRVSRTDIEVIPTFNGQVEENMPAGRSITGECRVKKFKDEEYNWPKC